MSTVTYSLKEFAHNLYRNPGTVLGSFLSLALLLAMESHKAWMRRRATRPG